MCEMFFFTSRTFAYVLMMTSDKWASGHCSAVKDLKYQTDTDLDKSLILLAKATIRIVKKKSHLRPTCSYMYIEAPRQCRQCLLNGDRWLLCL